MTRSRHLMAVLALPVMLPALLWAGPQVGSPAPVFTIPDTAWVNHSLTEWRGKVVQLFFWQST